jgi:hypothetical protein
MITQDHEKTSRNVSPAAAAFSETTYIKDSWLMKIITGYIYMLNNSCEAGNPP